MLCTKLTAAFANVIVFFTVITNFPAGIYSLLVRRSMSLPLIIGYLLPFPMNGEKNR